MTEPANHGTATEGFGSRAIATTAETHRTALSAAAQASVNARFIMALQRPRSWDEVRVRLLKECERPGFAEVARYLKPIGKGVEGPSIRFAEACLRYAGNMDAETTTTFEDRTKRILHVRCVDFESNASYSADITIDKTVERREIKDRVVLADRKNSRGERVFIVEATEDELLNKQNALVSKAVRTLVLRLIPGDIVDEAQRRCMETIRTRDAKDPAASRKALVDAFSEVGVFPKDLEGYLGHSLDVLQPAELTKLRQIYASLRDSESTWSAHVAAAKGEAEKPASDLEAKLREQPAPAPKPTSRNWTLEAEDFKAQIVAAHGKPKEWKALRAKFEKWMEEAPGDILEEVSRFSTAYGPDAKTREPGEEG